MAKKIFLFERQRGVYQNQVKIRKKNIYIFDKLPVHYPVVCWNPDMESVAPYLLFFLYYLKPTGNC